MPGETEYSIADLARLTGLNVRTIRYWISQGLIPASGESGPGTHYGQGHLDRLRLIKRLQAEYLPNAEIRRRLAPLSDDEVAGLVGSDPADPDSTRPTTSALEYVRGLLTGEAMPPAAAPPQRASAPPAAALPAPEAAPAALPPPDARAWARVAEAAAPLEPSEEPTTPMPERSQWERLSLGPNIELHIRRPLSRPEQRRVERLLTIARQVLDERNAP